MLLLILLIYDFLLSILVIFLLIKAIFKYKSVDKYLNEINLELANLRKK